MSGPIPAARSATKSSRSVHPGEAHNGVAGQTNAPMASAPPLNVRWDDHKRRLHTACALSARQTTLQALSSFLDPWPTAANRTYRDQADGRAAAIAIGENSETLHLDEHLAKFSKANSDLRP